MDFLPFVASTLEVKKQNKGRKMKTKPPRPGVTLLEMYAAENEVIIPR